jgi:hypothetical protein
MQTDRQQLAKHFSSERLSEVAEAKDVQLRNDEIHVSTRHPNRARTTGSLPTVQVAIVVSFIGPPRLQSLNTTDGFAVLFG